MKKIEYVIKFSEEKCSHEEMLYMRAKYICKLLEWKKSLKEAQAEV